MKNLAAVFGMLCVLGGAAPLVMAEPLYLAQSDARGLAFDVYIRLEQGMSEAELLVRAGKPDMQSVENTRNDIVKTYYYLPTSSDPWITTIRLSGGRIASLERIKKF